MPEPNERDVFKEPNEVESIGFHYYRYVSAIPARPKELWDKAVGFCDEAVYGRYRGIPATADLIFTSLR